MARPCVSNRDAHDDLIMPCVTRLLSQSKDGVHKAVSLSFNS